MAYDWTPMGSNDLWVRAYESAMQDMLQRQADAAKQQQGNVSNFLPSLPDGTIMTPDIIKRMQEQSVGDVVREEDAAAKGVQQSTTYQIQSSTWIGIGVIIAGFAVGYVILSKV